MMSITTKKHGSGSKQHSAGFRQRGYCQNKSHSPFSKKDKKSHQSKHEKTTKTNPGVDPLRSLKEGENNQETTSEVIHDL